MKNFFINKSRRVRLTPFTSRIEEQGVKSYTVYNHMLLPITFSSVEEEYLHLKKDVQVWDVSVQREIEISGKDSHRLVQLMTCRDLSNSKIGSCYYAPLVDVNGGIINDPLIYKLSDDKWRVCIADSDVLLFAKGIAGSKGLNVDIFEADINTLAIQGPSVARNVTMAIYDVGTTREKKIANKKRAAKIIELQDEFEKIKYREKFDLVLHVKLMKTFPDWPARMDYQKKQEEFYKSAIKKQIQLKRLRIQETSSVYTKEEVDAMNYFHGKGFYAKTQDSKTI